MKIFSKENPEDIAEMERYHEAVLLIDETYTKIISFDQYTHGRSKSKPEQLLEDIKFKFKRLHELKPYHFEHRLKYSILPKKKYYGYEF